MRRGICGSSLYDLGLLSNFKSVRIYNIFIQYYILY